MSDVFLFKLLDLYKKFSTKCKLTYFELRPNILEIIKFKIKGAVIGAVALSTKRQIKHQKRLQNAKEKKKKQP